MKNRYRHASFVADNRVIFNIGNKCQLVVDVNHDYGITFVNLVGTHSDYDRIDPETV